MQFWKNLISPLKKQKSILSNAGKRTENRNQEACLDFYVLFPLSSILFLDQSEPSSCDTPATLSIWFCCIIRSTGDQLKPLQHGGSPTSDDFSIGTRSDQYLNVNPLFSTRETWNKNLKSHKSPRPQENTAENTCRKPELQSDNKSHRADSGCHQAERE